MKRAILFVAVLVASTSTAAAQSFTDGFLRGAQAGAAARQRQADSEALRQFYARQNQLIEAQTRLIETQIKQLEVAEKAAAEAAKSQTASSATEIQAAIQKKIEVTLQVFTIIHPDWREFESQLVTFTKKIVPTAETNDIEYLEILYTLAKAKSAQASSK